MKIVSICIGGAVGALGRYAVSGAVYRLSQGTYPWGTLSVNVIGSLAMGFFWGAFDRAVVPAGARTFLLVGVLGAFTTFSTFSLETFSLLRDGELRLAVANVLATNVLCIAMVFAGFFVSRYVVDLVR